MKLIVTICLLVGSIASNSFAGARNIETDISMLGGRPYANAKIIGGHGPFTVFNFDYPVDVVDNFYVPFETDYLTIVDVNGTTTSHHVFPPLGNIVIDFGSVVTTPEPSGLLIAITSILGLRFLRR